MRHNDCRLKKTAVRRLKVKCEPEMIVPWSYGGRVLRTAMSSPVPRPNNFWHVAPGDVCPCLPRSDTPGQMNTEGLELSQRGCSPPSNVQALMFRRATLPPAMHHPEFLCCPSGPGLTAALGSGTGLGFGLGLGSGPYQCLGTCIVIRDAPCETVRQAPDPRGCLCPNDICALVTYLTFAQCAVQTHALPFNAHEILQT